MVDTLSLGAGLKPPVDAKPPFVNRILNHEHHACGYALPCGWLNKNNQKNKYFLRCAP